MSAFNGEEAWLLKNNPIEKKFTNTCDTHFTFKGYLNKNIILRKKKKRKLNFHCEMESIMFTMEILWLYGKRRKDKYNKAGFFLSFAKNNKIPSLLATKEVQYLQKSLSWHTGIRQW